MKYFRMTNEGLFQPISLDDFKYERKHNTIQRLACQYQQRNACAVY